MGAIRIPGSLAAGVEEARRLQSPPKQKDEPPEPVADDAEFAGTVQRAMRWVRTAGYILGTIAFVALLVALIAAWCQIPRGVDFAVFSQSAGPETLAYAGMLLLAHTLLGVGTVWVLTIALKTAERLIVAVTINHIHRADAGKGESGLLQIADLLRQLVRHTKP